MGKSIHKMSYTRIYKTWMGMKSRCAYEKDKHYLNYGGRGIKVCDEWQNNFSTFYEWAMANGYSDNLTIDRVDVNGNYEPNNCRWVDRKTQANNRTNNKVIEYRDEMHTLAEWSEILGVKYETLAARLNKYKWSVEQAFSTGPLPRGWNLRNGQARSIHTK
jgi:hypothetical protein